MCRYAKGLNHNFRTATLAYLQIHFRSFTNYHIIRFHFRTYFSRGNTFEAFFMHNTCHIYISGKIFPIFHRISMRSNCKCGYRTFHISSSSSIKLSIFNNCMKWIMFPIL